MEVLESWDAVLSMSFVFPHVTRFLWFGSNDFNRRPIRQL